jgi:hypothetical protein
MGFGNCSTCHGTGAGGFFAAPDPTVTFQETTQLPYIRPWVDCTADVQGNFHGFVPSSAIFEEGAGCDGGPAPCHPTYQLPAELVCAIDGFVMASIARWNAGSCAPPPPADGGPG